MQPRPSLRRRELEVAHELGDQRYELQITEHFDIAASRELPPPFNVITSGIHRPRGQTLHSLSSRCYTQAARQYKPNPNGPNYRLCQHLERSLNEASSSRDSNEFKIRALVDAIKALDKWESPIRSGEDAMRLYGIGEGVARRIDEFLGEFINTNDASHMDGDEVQRMNVMRQLMKLPGIGVVRARRLVDEGCMSVKDLKDSRFSSSLPKSVQLSVKYSDFLSVDVSRKDCEAIKDTIESLISSEFDMHIVGSYRRGQEVSSSIDVLLFHPSFVHVEVPSSKNLMMNNDDSKKATVRSIKRNRTEVQARQEELLESHVIVPLSEQGVIAGTLAFGHRKWQGIVRIPSFTPADYGNTMEALQERLVGIKNRNGEFRRVDISIFPERSRGAALLALTGDKDFNRHTRSLASRQGMLLNENGLWRWRPQSNDFIETDDVDGFWELVASETEEDVLEHLGMEWVDPEKRNYAFLNRRNGKQKKN